MKKIIFIFCFILLCSNGFSQFGDGSDGEFNGGTLINSEYKFTKVELFSGTTMEFTGSQNKVIYVQGDFIIHQGASIIPQLVDSLVQTTLTVSGITVNLNTQVNSFGYGGGGGNGVGINSYSGGSGGNGNAGQYNGSPGNVYPGSPIASGGTYYGGDGVNGGSGQLDPWGQSGYTNGGGGGACGYHGMSRDNIIFIVGGEIIIEGSIIGNGENGGKGGNGGLGATPRRRGRFHCCGGGGGGGTGGNGGNGSNIYFFCKSHYTFNENLVDLKGGALGKGGIGGIGGVDGSVNGQDNLWGGKGSDGSIGYSGLNGSITFNLIGEDLLKISDSCSYQTHYIECPLEDYFVLHNDSYTTVCIDSIVFPENLVGLVYGGDSITICFEPDEKKIFQFTPIMDSVGTFLVPIQINYTHSSIPFIYVVDIESKSLSIIENRNIINFPANSGFDTIIVQSSTVWEVSPYSNWFSIYQSYYGVGSDTVIIQYQQNNTNNNRYGYIVLSGFLDSDTVFFAQDSGINYPDWEVVYYSNNTTLYGSIEVCHEYANEDDIVGAFVNDECRGIGKVININGQTYTSIVVQGEQQEEVEFKLWYSQYQVIYDIDFTINTNPGGFLGLPPDYLLLKVNNCQYEIDSTVCYGDEVFLAGEFQTETGIYVDTLVSYEGYDSILITSLFVNPVYETNVYDTICEGQSYFAQGENQFSSGLYYDTLATVKGCDSVLITNLLVNPIQVIDITLDSSSTVICSGEQVIIESSIPATGISLTYLWYLNGVLLVNNQANYTSSTLNDGDSVYCIVQTDYECVTQSIDTSNILVFTVYDEFMSGTISQNQIICYNTLPSEIISDSLPIGGEGSYTYQWQDSVINGSWSDISAATSFNHLPTSLTDTTYYKLIATDSCGMVVSNIIEVAVYDELITGTISQNQIICYNTTPSQLGFSTNTIGGEGNYTYQWQDSIINGSWLNISGATSFNHQHATLSDTTYFRLILTDLCGIVTTNVVEVAVYDELIAGSINQDQIICYNTIPDSINVSVNTTGGEGNYINQWQSSPDGIVFSDITGANYLTYGPAALTSTTHYQLKIIDNCDTVYSNFITITVYDDLIPSIIGNDQEICYNSVPNIMSTITSASGGVGNYTYQWYEALDTLQWSLITSANQISYQPSNLTDTTYFKYEVSDSCGLVTSNVVRIGVYDEFVPGTISQSQDICYNTIPAELLSNLLPEGGEGIYTYQWQDSVVNGNWTNISDATSINYQPPTLSDTAYYKLVTSDPCGIVASNIIEIGVYDDLNAGTIGNDQLICAGDVPYLLDIINMPTGGGSSYSYQWQQSPNNNTWTDITGETYTTYQSGPLTETTDFRLLITSNMGCGTVLSNEVMATVTPQPVSYAGADDTICEDAVYQLSGYAENYTSHIWSVVIGNGTFSDPTILNPIYTPHYTDLLVGHVRLSLTVDPQTPCAYPDIDMMMIFFEELPIVDAGIDDVICESGTFEVLTSSASSYSTLLWSGGDGTFDDPTVLMPIYSPGEDDINNGGIYLKLTAFSNSPCTVAFQDSLFLEIQWLPVVNSGSDTLICESDCININGSVLNSTGFEWSTSGEGIFYDENDLTTTYCPAETDINNGFVTITLTANSISPCNQSVSDSFVLSFSLLPIAEAGDDITICETTTEISVNGATVANENSIYWQTSGDGNFNDSTTIHPTYYPGEQDIANGYVELLLIAEPILPCSQPDSDILSLYIMHLPTSNAGDDGIICENQIYDLTGLADNYSFILWEDITGDGTFECDTCLSTSFDPGEIDILNGDAIITLTSYSISPCAIDNIDSTIVFIQPLPTSNAGEDDVICEGESYTLSGSGENYTHTYWGSMGDGSFDDRYILNATYIPGPNDILEGYADLLLFAYSISPCLGEIEDTMSLYIELSPVVFAGDDDEICEGESYILSASAENYSTINWTTSGDGTFDDSGLLTATYTPGTIDIDAGTVELSLTAYANLPCNVDTTDVMNLAINYYPGQPMLPEGPVYIDPGVTQFSEYIINQVPNSTSYHWYLEPIAAGTISSDDTVGTVYWNTSYSGSAFVYVSAINGCGEFTSDTLEVGLITGINNSSTIDLIINIAPNPTNGKSIVTIDGCKEDVDLFIINSTGQVIQRDKLIESSNKIIHNIDLSTQPSGTYFLKFVLENEILVRKVVVEKRF